MEQKARREGTYHIKTRGIPESSISIMFPEVIIIRLKDDEMVLAGRFADQAALRGFLDQIWNLNLTVLSVDRIESQAEVEEPPYKKILAKD